MRILLTVSYAGTNFCGYQRQPNKRTVEEELQIALRKLLNKPVKTIASGRTDSGVHALCQVAHFDIEKGLPPEKYAPALNSVLPDDVQVLFSMQAPVGFHARFGAKKKTYRYTFYVSDVKLPLKEAYAQRIVSADVKKMQEGAKYLVGEHDFKCFLASNSSVKDTVRRIYSCKVSAKGNEIYLEVCGNGFLYNMVRTIAGTLLYVGEGKYPPEYVKEILQSKERVKAGKTMPAKGLMLKNVCYKGLKLPKIY